MTQFNAQAFEALIDGSSLLSDHIDTPYITTSETFNSEDDLREYLQARVSEAEVIYYVTAAQFLLENDPSLNEAFALAFDCGYTLERLNSEVLATLLLQQKLSEELGELDLAACFIETTDEAKTA